MNAIARHRRIMAACWISAVIGCSATDARAATPHVLRQLRSLDAAAGDEFGLSVSLDGALGLIGAPSRDEVGVASGAAYLMDVLSGEQRFKLVPSDGQASSKFGISVALQGDRAVVPTREWT